ncbi:hypothetical protein [Corynebacterium sp.]|uniref:hypothetical protein n=1 Tax=Corynebacterium sp. TaxID=1720 RepID=UPI0026DD8DAF|nr:hypothetical protein [Corynebacterium sp.]MDO5076065.1 hypothetical protein [Corynebacterium sp.]
MRGNNARKTLLVGAGILVTSALVLAGCSAFGGKDDTADAESAESTVSASAVSKPTFSAKDVDDVIVDEIYGNHHDPGLNVEWTLVGAQVAPYGGVAVSLYIKNLNDVPLPPDAVKSATLKLKDYSGNVTEVEPLDKDSSGVESGLDLPLGVGAKTTITYAFNTTIGNLYSSELKVGNVVFRGSLVG